MSKIRLYGSTSGYTELVPPAAAADNAITLPNTVGEAVVKDSSGNIRVNSINSGPLAGFRNAIINGNFDVWQRGTSVTAFGMATADRWSTRSAVNTGGNLTQSQQAFTLGQTDVPGEPRFYWRLVFTGATGTPYVVHRIEGVRSFAGQTVTLSFWARRSSSSSSCYVDMVQAFGTGGSPSTVVTTSSTTFEVGTSWTYITRTFSIPSITGKTLGTDDNDYLEIRPWLGGTGNFTFELAQVQLEAGPVATPFERRPTQIEFELCERYYQICDYTNGGYVTGGSVTIAGRGYYHTTMRTNPIATIYGYGVIGGAPATSAGVTITTGINSYIQAFLATAAYYVNYGVYLNAEL